MFRSIRDSERTADRDTDSDGEINLLRSGRRHRTLIPPASGASSTGFPSLNANAVSDSSSSDASPLADSDSAASASVSVSVPPELLSRVVRFLSDAPTFLRLVYLSHSTKSYFLTDAEGIHAGSHLSFGIRVTCDRAIEVCSRRPTLLLGGTGGGRRRKRSRGGSQSRKNRSDTLDSIEAALESLGLDGESKTDREEFGLGVVPLSVCPFVCRLRIWIERGAGMGCNGVVLKDDLFEKFPNLSHLDVFENQMKEEEDMAPEDRPIVERRRFSGEERIRARQLLKIVSPENLLHIGLMNSELSDCDITSFMRSLTGLSSLRIDACLGISASVLSLLPGGLKRLEVANMPDVGFLWTQFGPSQQSLTELVGYRCSFGLIPFGSFPNLRIIRMHRVKELTESFAQFEFGMRVRELLLRDCPGLERDASRQVLAPLALRSVSDEQLKNMDEYVFSEKLKHQT